MLNGCFSGFARPLGQGPRGPRFPPPGGLGPSCFRDRGDLGTPGIMGE